MSRKLLGIGVFAVLFIVVKCQERKAIAVLKNADAQGNVVSGNLTFVQGNANGPVRVRGTIYGLKPGLHGFHIHEKGDLSGGCATAGGHFNPDNKKHGAPSARERHVGDLGNVKAEENGETQVDITDDKISLSGRRSILGRALVVHSGEDDLGLGGTKDSLTTGNAGSRVACAVLGIMSPVTGWEWDAFVEARAAESSSAMTSVGKINGIFLAVSFLSAALLKFRF